MLHQHSFSWVRGSASRILVSKIHPSITITQYWIPPRNSVDQISVVIGYIPSNGSYTYCYLNNLYDSLHRVFSLSIILILTSEANWSLSFALSECIISYLNGLIHLCRQQRKGIRKWTEHTGNFYILENINLSITKYWFYYYNNLCKTWMNFKRSFFRVIKSSVIKFWILILEHFQYPLV